MYLLEHGQDSHRVHGGDQAAKQEEIQQPDVQVPCRTGRAVKAGRGPPGLARRLPWAFRGFLQAAVLLAAGLEAVRMGTLSLLGLRLAGCGNLGRNRLPPSHGLPQP